VEEASSMLNIEENFIIDEEMSLFIESNSRFAEACVEVSALR
jgi:hypothetical protein